MKFQNFKSTSEGLALYLAKTSTCLALFIVSFKLILMAFSILGTLWGIGAILFKFTLSLWLFLRYMLPARNLNQAIDGMFCITIVYAVVVGIIVLGIIISQSLTVMFNNPSLGWMVFAGTLCFVFLLCARVSSYYSEK